MQYYIRRAEASDVHVLHGLIRELAVFDNLEHQFTITEQRLREDGWGNPPRFFAWLAESPSQHPIGYALGFFTYSSWKGLAAYGEDVYVRPEYRHQRVGTDLFRVMVKFAADNGCQRVKWETLRTNEAALRWYEAIGSQRTDQWVPHRLEKQDMDRFLQQLGG